VFVKFVLQIHVLPVYPFAHSPGPISSLTE